MNDSDPSQQSQDDRKFNQEQYDLLLRCSKNRDISEWNEWREDNENVQLHLEGASLPKAHLAGANLMDAHLEGAQLTRAVLKNADLYGAHLDKANLYGSNLERAELRCCYLRGANLRGASLEGADLEGASAQRAVFVNANLAGANLKYSSLSGSVFREADLRGADLRHAIIDDNTLFWNCTVNRRTDFRGVALNVLQIDAGTKQCLEYNIRRMNWEDWYRIHPLRQILVRSFWWMSDYGRSTGRVMLTFLALALGFAAVYYICGVLHPPGIVTNLFEGPEGPVPTWLVPIRVLYFSVVTMTTLGFGDMYANCQSLLGHVLLTLQVLLGYVLLGAIVTRLAILFGSGGPSAKFSNE